MTSFLLALKGLMHCTNQQKGVDVSDIRCLTWLSSPATHAAALLLSARFLSCERQ
jgi:hypothetical protein